MQYTLLYRGVYRSLPRGELSEGARSNDGDIRGLGRWDVDGHVLGQQGVDEGVVDVGRQLVQPAAHALTIKILHESVGKGSINGTRACINCLSQVIGTAYSIEKKSAQINISRTDIPHVRLGEYTL